MKPSEYLKHDAVGLAGLVARREISAEALLAIALEQNARVHPKVNAVCRLMEKEARAHLLEPLSGPFAGVPFLIKDIAHDYAGVPTTQGSRSMLSAVPNEHANMARRYLGAGFVVFGDEGRLLQLARQLEGARAWFDRRPDWVTPSE